MILVRGRGCMDGARRVCLYVCHLTRWLTGQWPPLPLVNL